MQTYEEKIWTLAEPAVTSEGMELIHVECLRMKTRWLVRLFIDKENGVTVDDCADVSHQIGDILDVHDTLPGPYNLEVSSPGPNRPLSRSRDFLKYRGSRINVKTDQKIEGKRNFRGILVDFKEGEHPVLTIDVSGEVFEIPREAVVKASVDVDFTGEEKFNVTRT